MLSFYYALIDPLNQFLRFAFLIGILASISFGITGSFVVVKRITYIAGAIAHCILGGIGFGFFLKHKMNIIWFDPMYGAVIFALLSAIIIGLVPFYAKQREDTIISALWAIGMALGLIFIDLTPGYFNISSYLFGDILLISKKDIWLVLGLDIFIISICFYFYNKFTAICFDNEFAKLRGIKVEFFYILLLCLTALSIVLLIRIVGIIMVIALMTLPSAIAGRFVKKLWQMMILSIFLCISFTLSGLAVSYNFSLSSGPCIILIAGITYLGVILIKK